MINSISITTSNRYPGGGGYIITDALALAYANELASVEGYTLTNVEAESIDNFCKRIKGEDPAYANFGDAEIFNQAQGLQISPMLGDTLGTKKYNLMDPSSTSLQQTYVGGCTANYDGVTTNGVNGYINSNIIADNFAGLDSSSVCVGNVLRDSTSRWDFGNYATNSGFEGNLWRRMGTGVSSYGRSWCLDNTVGGGGNDDNQGHTWINLFALPSEGENYHNGVLESTNSTNLRPSAFSQLVLPFGGVNVNGNTFAQASNTMMFGHYFSGLNPTMVPVWSTIVDDFMNELGKKTW